MVHQQLTSWTVKLCAGLLKDLKLGVRIRLVEEVEVDASFFNSI